MSTETKNKKTPMDKSYRGLYFRTGLGALCKALPRVLNACNITACMIDHFYTIEDRIQGKNDRSVHLLIGPVHLGIESITFAILIELDEKELSRMVLHHTEYTS